MEKEDHVDTTVLQPAPGQAVVATHDRHDRHDRHERHERHNHDLEQVIAKGVLDNAKSIGDAKYDVTAAVERSGIATREQTSDIRRELSHEIGTVKTRVDDQFARTQKDVSDLGYETLKGFKEGQVQALEIEGRGLLEAERNRNLLAVQADKNTYQLQLQATTNAAAAAAQLAECCCELKEKITAEAVETRALINTIESNRLRDELAACKAANTAYFTRGIPPVVPG